MSITLGLKGHIIVALNLNLLFFLLVIVLELDLPTQPMLSCLVPYDCF
jgi:hypothetical protein